MPEKESTKMDLKTLSALRRGKLGAFKCKMNAVRSLIAKGKDTERILNGVEQFKMTQ